MHILECILGEGYLLHCLNTRWKRDFTFTQSLLFTYTYMEGTCITIHMHNISYNIRQKKGNMKKRKTKNYMLIQKKIMTFEGQQSTINDDKHKG